MVCNLFDTLYLYLKVLLKIAKNWIVKFIVSTLPPYRTGTDCYVDEGPVGKANVSTFGQHVANRGGKWGFGGMLGWLTVRSASLYSVVLLWKHLICIELVVWHTMNAHSKIGHFVWMCSWSSSTQIWR